MSFAAGSSVFAYAGRQARPNPLFRGPPPPPPPRSRSSNQHVPRQHSSGAAGHRQTPERRSGAAVPGTADVARSRPCHEPATHPYDTPPARRCWVPHAGKAAGTATSGLGSGLLVAAVKGDRHVLALVTEPDGKKNWWLQDARGHRWLRLGRCRASRWLGRAQGVFRRGGGATLAAPRAAAQQLPRSCRRCMRARQASVPTHAACRCMPAHSAL